MDEKPLFTIARWFAAILAIVLLLALLLPAESLFSSRVSTGKSMSSIRQVMTALRLYAADHNGRYPNGATANQVFREMIRAEVMDSEHIFGCDISPYRPDGEIGSKPDFAQALEPGENHWAMTANLNDQSDAQIPLVYENASTIGWPPKWNADAAEKAVKGRSWREGKIIIGLNDTSARLYSLAAKSGAAVGLAPEKGETKNLFEKAIEPVHFPKGKILDVE